jgi:hypothetical protein
MCASQESSSLGSWPADIPRAIPALYPAEHTQAGAIRNFPVAFAGQLNEARSWRVASRPTSRPATVAFTSRGRNVSLPDSRRRARTRHREHGRAGHIRWSRPGGRQPSQKRFFADTGRPPARRPARGFRLAPKKRPGRRRAHDEHDRGIGGPSAARVWRLLTGEPTSREPRGTAEILTRAFWESARPGLAVHRGAVDPVGH